MEQTLSRLDELKAHVLEQLEGTGLPQLFWEHFIEDLYERWDGLHSNLYRLAQRIADELILNYHHRITNVAF